MSDYTDSGYDSFLSRSIDDLPQANLDSTGPVSTQVRYDSSQVSGFLGDTFRFGGVGLEGKDNRMTLTDTDNLRVVIGQQSDGSEDIIISKPGIDADISRPDDLIFTGSQNTFKIVKTDTVITSKFTVTSSNAGTWTSDIITETFAHNLGYAPIALVYQLTSDGKYRPLPDTTIPSFGTNSSIATFFQTSFYTDSVYLYVYSAISIFGITSGFTGPLTLKYYLLKETAN